jgi:hypothetical protein
VSDLIVALGTGLGSALCIAGVLKIASPIGGERMVMVVLPAATWRWTTSRVVVRATAALEVLLGALLLVSSGRLLNLVAIAATALGAVMLVTTRMAGRRQVPCGCVGGSRRPAGAPEIIRAAIVMLAATALAFLTSAAPAIALGQRRADIALVAVALAVVMLALPELLAAGRAALGDRSRAQRNPARPSRPTSTDGFSRKAFLTRAAAVLGALIGAGALPRAARANPPRTCQDQYNLCYGCDPDENTCCISCYVTCQLGGACTPNLSCGGCWPGP